MPTSTGFRQHSFLRVLLVLVASAHCLLLVQGFQTFLPTRTRATSSFSLSVHRPSANSDNDRRSLLTDALKTAGLVGMAWGTAATALPGGANAAAKKIINLEEARELGEKKMIEIEKAKGPLIKVRDNVKYREELTGKGPTFEQGDLVKVRYQVYKVRKGVVAPSFPPSQRSDDEGGRTVVSTPQGEVSKRHTLYPIRQDDPIHLTHLPYRSKTTE